MRVKYIYGIITLMGFLNISTAFAQDESVWTLDRCITHAVENNISLKRQALETEITQHDFRQSKLNALPDLNGQMEHNLGSGRILDRGTYEWLNTDVSQGDLGLMSNFTLFKGLQGYNNIKKSEANYNASQSMLQLIENNLLIKIMTGYLDLLRKEELYEIALEKLELTGKQVKRMEKLVEVGNASMGELLEVKAQASEEKYNMTIAKNQMDVSRLTLIQLLNLQDTKGFLIDRPELPDPSALQIQGLDDVYQAALKTLPQIEGAHYNIVAQEKQLAVARGAFSPEVYIRALYYSNYSDKLINPRDPDPMNPSTDYPVSQQVSDNQYRQVSLGVNIPIFNKWQLRTNVSRAKIGLEDAMYQLEDEKQQLLKEIQQYHADAMAALGKYESALESVTNSEEAYRYAEERFKVGTATALELEEARNRLFQARTEQISSKYDFVFYVKILDFYQGKGLEIE
mgnify:CR=1 FL=1